MKSAEYIKENIEVIKEKIATAAIKAGRDPSEVSLMAVTKTVPTNIINAAIENGVGLIGENRAQELLNKVDEYTKETLDIHFIGALQTNKVRQIIPYISTVQSVDRISLVKELQKQCEIHNKIVDVLIQVNVGEEATKSGIMPGNVVQFSRIFSDYSHLRLRGIMSIPPNSDKYEETCNYFASLRQYLVDIQQENRDNGSINVLSIGMSGDYQTAIEYGATIVRIGSALFGERT